MEFWPADFRTNISSVSAQKKRKGKATYVNEQHLEPGSLGAATLISGAGLLEWTTAFQPRRGQVPRVVGNSLEFFPPTRPLPPRLPRLSVHQRAEQGARFLRTYHPDVDIPFELIKDELQSDEEEAVADSVLDPYAGNRLAHSSFQSKRKQKIHFLVFPSGETGSDLNVSPFRVNQTKQFVFSPSATPVLSFNTPIQQVVDLSPGSESSQDYSLLAVRTHSTVSLVKVQESSTVGLERPSLTATGETSIVLPDTGGRRVADVSGGILSTSDVQALLINDMGAVYNIKVERPEKTTVIANSAWESESSETDQFWRVIRRDVNTGMRSSSKKVQLFDLRAPTVSSFVLFTLSEEMEFLTSIDTPLQGRNLMCLSTTNKLVWFDERNQKGPVLSLKHKRAFDRTLRAETVDYGPFPLTMLSSTVNSLVTVYDINYGPSGYIHAYGEPSMLAGSSTVSPLAGSTYFRHSAAGGPDFDMFQLSSRGSLWRTKIAFLRDSDGAVEQDFSEVLEWTADVHALAAKSKAIGEDLSPLGEREFLDADLRGAYEKVFQIHEVPSDISETDAEAVYQTLERMPFFWQDMDGPAEHMLLTFDVAFRCGVEPSHASRADFLTESLLSSPQGFVALARERIPIPRLVSTVRWHYDLNTLPASMIPNIASRSQTLIDQLREEALAHAATAEGMRRVIEATQHLALDLALSRHIYAPQSFSTKVDVAPGNEIDDSNLLLQATRAMSLGDAEPPTVQFGFLHPLEKSPFEEDEQMESDHESENKGVELSLGVRLLLSQWEDGADPQKYVYKDPYMESETPSAPRRLAPAKRGQDQQRPNVPAVVSVQRAPPVVASTSRPLVDTRTGSMFELGSRPISGTFSDNLRPTNSQEFHAPSTHLISSQEQGPSTQPLPGPFGGGSRQKKAGKRRMGGF